MGEILDVKDMKILLALDNDARQSDSRIAKKINLSKQSVSYRIKRLQKIGLISKFSTVINSEKLGYCYFNIFLKMQNLNEEVENEFIDFVKKASNITWAVKTIGHYNFLISIIAKNTNEFNEHLSKLLSKFGKHISEYDLFVVTEAFRTPYKYFSKEGIEIPKIDLVRKQQPIVKLSEIDLNVLQILDEAPLMKITEIAEKLKLTASIVSYSIKKLVKEGIIQSFRPQIDCSKLGLQWHIALFKLNYVNSEEQKKFISYLLQHKQVVYLVIGVGSWNMMLDLHVKDMLEMNKILNEIKNKFSNIIKSESVVMVPELYKVRFCAGN